MGTPEFAIPTLEAIVKSGYNVVGVITAPDRQSGRGRKVRMSAIKEYALENNLNILQPTNLKDENFLLELKSLQANLQVVVAFRMLPKSVWSMPELGTFNLHASLLPQYRGAAPINYAIINGDTKTGLTTFFLDEEIDTGKIIDQYEVEINYNDNVGTLHDRLKNLGGELVLRTIDKIINKSVKLIDQKSTNEKLRPAPKLFKENCRINWEKPSKEIYNFIRGLSPYPAAFSTLVSDDYDSIITKIYEVKIVTEEKSEMKPGSIITDGRTYINVVTGYGILGIIELQLAGKKRMSIIDFLRGFNKIDKFRFN